MTKSQATLRKQNRIRNVTHRAKAHATNRRACCTVTPTSTATPTPTPTPTPIKRGRKPKFVPHLKRTRLEKEKKDRFATAKVEAQITAHAKLRGKSLAINSSLNDDIMTASVTKQSQGPSIYTTPIRRGIRSNQSKPVNL